MPALSASGCSNSPFPATQSARFGIYFVDAESLEVSIVPIPANTNALVETRAQGFRALPLAGFADRAATVERAPDRRAHLRVCCGRTHRSIGLGAARGSSTKPPAASAFAGSSASAASN
jgi:hypothetical protein